jgi:hypothetical protein
VFPFLIRSLVFAVTALCSVAGEAQTGAIAPGKAHKCMIVSSGHIRVTGGDTAEIRYRLTARRGAAQVRAKPTAPGMVKIWTEGDGAAHSELEVTIPRPFGAVAIESATGPVELESLDSEIFAKCTAGAIRLDRLTRAATVKTGGGEIRAGRLTGALRAYSAGGSISIEAGSEIQAASEGGEIRVREAAGRVVAHTAGGSIQIGTAASVDARTGAGIITIGSAGGTVSAYTSAGSIEIGRAAGVRAESGSGAIRLKRVGGAIDARTGYGPILADLTALTGASTFRTSRGDIVLLIPSNLVMTVDAFSQTAGDLGKIVSDFPEIRPRTAAREGKRGMEALGSRGGGGPMLRLDSAGGVIELRKKPQEK